MSLQKLPVDILIQNTRCISIKVILLNLIGENRPLEVYNPAGSCVESGDGQSDRRLWDDY